MAEIEDIAKAFEADDKESKVYSAAEVPPTYDSITDEWLTDALSNGVAGAKVVGHSLDERDDGSSNRRRIFMDWNDAGKAGGLPPTVFCKMSENLANRITLAASGAAEGEAIYYNSIRPLLDIETFSGIYAKFDPETFRSLIVMPDMFGKVTFGHHSIEVTKTMAEGMVRTLAGLHGTMYEHPILTDLKLRSWAEWWKDMMDVTPMFGPSCMKAWDESAELGIIPSGMLKHRDEIWPLTMASAARHHELPHTYTHNDVHFKNWYITNEGQRMGLSDWQCCTKGHWSRDVMYALTTALTIDNRRAWMEDLVKLYVEEMKARGVAMPRLEDVWKNLRQQSMTALAFWTITLVPAPSMPDMQPRDITVEFLKRFCAWMDDYDAIAAFK
jgi:hypothetical protein